MTRQRHQYSMRFSYSTRRRTWSPCNWCSTGVMWSHRRHV